MRFETITPEKHFQESGIHSFASAAFFLWRYIREIAGIAHLEKGNTFIPHDHWQEGTYAIVVYVVVMRIVINT